MLAKTISNCSVEQLLTGPSIGVSNFRLRNVPEFEFTEFRNMPISDDYPEYDDLATGGIGPGTSGIYFDEDLASSSISPNSPEKNIFLQRYSEEIYSFLNERIDFNNTDIYMSYGRFSDLSAFYIELAKKMSQNRYHIIFIRKEDYIKEYGHLYNKFSEKFYWRDKTILIAGSLPEIDFKKVLLLSNKIVHCTGNMSVSQVISAKKIPLYDYIGFSEYFIDNMYSLMSDSGVQVAGFLLDKLSKTAQSLKSSKITL